MHFNSFRGRGRGGFAVPSAPRGQGEDQQPNEARRMVQLSPVNNAPSRGAGWRSGPLRGLPRTRGGARANLISLPNANSAPPPIPVNHPAPVVSAHKPTESALQSQPTIPAVITPPASVTLSKLEPSPLLPPSPPPPELPAPPDPLIKLERDLSPTLPDVPPEPRLEGSVFLKRPGRIPQNSPAWNDWKNTQVEALKSQSITVVRVLNRADGVAFDWRSSLPVVVHTDTQSAHISVIRPAVPIEPLPPPPSSHGETTAPNLAPLREAPVPVASASQITSDARTSPSRMDTEDTAPATVFLVSIPTFLHKTGFKNQEFNSWVALEKQELAARGWTVLGSEVQQEDNLLELRATSRYQHIGRRGRGQSTAQSAELVPGDVDGSLQIQMPSFLDTDAISRALWIRVQVDRAEQQMECQHPRTEIVGNQLRIIFSQSEPSSSSDIIDLTDSITEPGSPPEAPRKRKRSSSRPSSPEVPMAKRRADSAEPLAKILERRHGHVSSTGGTPVPRASSASHEMSSKRDERLSIDDPDSSDTAIRKLARRFLKSFLGAFSVLDRAAMLSAYDASAVLTCDLRDIGPTAHGGGLHTIGFDQILERLGSIGNFVHALNSDFDFEITSLPDARYLLNVHGDILYLPVNTPRRVMNFRHNFHLRRQRTSEDFPFSIVTHDLIVSRKEVVS